MHGICMALILNEFRFISIKFENNEIYYTDALIFLGKIVRLVKFIDEMFLIELVSVCNQVRGGTSG